MRNGFIYLILCILILSSFVTAKTREDYLKDKDKYNVNLIDSNGKIISGYIEIPEKPQLNFHGTEYYVGQTAKPWLQLLNSTFQSITSGVCFIDIYTPENTILIEKAKMYNLNHDGIYYYDLYLNNFNEGVYPVIANCYYNSIETEYYATNYFINRGTYESGTLTDMQTIDGNFIRFKENSPNPRRINIGFNYTNLNSCANVSESLLNSISIDLTAKFDSVLNDFITINIYNFTAQKFQPLYNNFQKTNNFVSVSNTITLNNLTKSGIYNVNYGIILLLNDTNITDGSDTNFDIDELTINCNQLQNQEWQELKGSSEIHISNYQNITLITSDIWNYANRTLTESYILNNSYYYNYSYFYENNNSFYYNYTYLLEFNSSYFYENNNSYYFNYSYFQENNNSFYYNNTYFSEFNNSFFYEFNNSYYFNYSYFTYLNNTNNYYSNDDDNFYYNFSYYYNNTYLLNDSSYYNNSYSFYTNESNYYYFNSTCDINLTSNISGLNEITGNILKDTQEMKGDSMLIGLVLLLICDLILLFLIKMNFINAMYSLFTMILGIVLFFLFWIPYPILSYFCLLPIIISALTLFSAE